jgi:hypothetical protein
MALAKFFVHRKGGNRTVVRPPSDVATKSSSGRVEVTNRTSDVILVNMPGGVFGTGAAPDPPTKHTVNASGGKLVLQVHTNAQEGAFDFQIFAMESFTFAQANSDPEFIIEP